MKNELANSTPGTCTLHTYLHVGGAIIRKVNNVSLNCISRYQDKTPPDKNPPDINPQKKPPGQKPLAKNPPDKTYEHKIYFT